MEANILVVGAGGIGCELLKILVLSGFSNITVVDCDTIDKSNLNRQFLFRKEHIGLPKSEVAASVLLAWNSNLNIKSLYKNITDLGTTFFENFKVVLNALDNLEARRYVNRVCLAVNIPFIDSGTEGKIGQVSVHVPGKTACYECEPKNTPKTYPVCTIRSTPTKPVHCVVWAKYLYEAFCGQQDSQNYLSDLFSMEKDTSQLLDLFRKDLPEQAKPLEFTQPTPQLMEEYSEPSIETCTSALLFCFEKLKARSPAPFDKDDQLSMQFVTAASNLRSANFGIEMLSVFECKKIAGNIVPAVATTNAVAAALQVVQAIKFLLNEGPPKNAWITQAKGDRPIMASSVMGPNPNCYACSKANVTFRGRLSSVTLEQVLVLLKEKLSVFEPSIVYGSQILYESGEGLEEDEIEHYASNSQKTLSELGLSEAFILDCDDYKQNFKFFLLLKDSCTEEPEIILHLSPSQLTSDS